MSNYINEITNEFINRRGQTLQISPLDWELIGKWEAEGIPLRIVLRAINGIFDNYDVQKRKKPIKSISYCEGEIQEAFGNWLATQVGK